MHTLALAHYRAGNADQAIECFHKSLNTNPKWSGNVCNWLGLTLAYWEKRDRDEARRWFDTAEQWMAKNGPKPGDEAQWAIPNLHPHDWLACRVLYREAEALIRGTKK